MQWIPALAASETGYWQLVQWSDVDMQHKLIHVRRAVSGLYLC